MEVLAEQLSTGNLGAIGDSGGSEFRFAQSFQLDEDAIIASVEVSWGAEDGGPFSGDVTCRIETDSSDTPSGTLVHANATVAIDVTASAWNTHTFTGPFEVSADTKYWIRFTCNDQSSGVRILHNMTSSGSYPDGSYKYTVNGGAWAAASGDLTFKINGQFTADVLEEQLQVAGNWASLGNGAGDDYIGAQGFTIPAKADLTTIDILFATTLQTPSGDMNLRIETDSSGSPGVPSGTLVASHATVGITLTSDTAWNSWTYSTPVVLEATTVYHLRFLADTWPQDAGDRWILNGTSTNCGVGGSYHYTINTGTWVTVGGSGTEGSMTFIAVGTYPAAGVNQVITFF